MTQWLVKDPEDLQEIADTHLGQAFAIDLETSGLDYEKDRILGIALTFEDGGSYYIVSAHTEPENTTMGESSYPVREYIHLSEVRRELHPLFSQNNVEMIAHNLKFELHFLSRAGIELSGILHDTMLMAQILDENRPVGLKKLAPLVGMKLDEYADLEHYPGFKPHEILGVPLPLTARYAMGDTEATLALWQKFSHEMAGDPAIQHAYENTWMRLLPVLQQMERRGIAMAMDRVNGAVEEFSRKADEAFWEVWKEGVKHVLDEEAAVGWVNLPDNRLAKLRDVLEHGSLEGDVFVVHGVELPVFRKENRKAFLPRVPWFNPGSDDQVRELVYGRLGLALPKDIRVDLTESGKLPIDKDALRVLKHHLGPKTPPVLNSILEYRKYTKILGTYLTVYQEKCDENDHYALRTSFNQASTDTGRLSSSGPNLQNQPARGEDGATIRSLFVARPGMKLVVADYSMMELRMAAHYSKDAAMARAFEEGLDLHSLTGAGQEGMPYEEFVERLESGDPLCKQARQIGKTSNFGLLYGMGAEKFQRFLLTSAGVSVTLREAQRLIDLFEATYPGIQEWKTKVHRFVQRHGYVDTIGGRKRRFPHISYLRGPDLATALRQAVNAQIQGSCFDVIADVMPPIHHMFVGAGGSLLLQVHDELVGEAPVGVADSVAERMAEMMVAPINKHLSVPLACEARTGYNWKEAK